MPVQQVTLLSYPSSRRGTHIAGTGDIHLRIESQIMAKGVSEEMGNRTTAARRITEERRAIQRRLRGIIQQTTNSSSLGQDLFDHRSPDVLDQAEQRRLKEQKARTCELLTSRLKALDRAWENLQQGIYGICQLCEQEIPRKRLEAVPTATFCVPCQGLLE